MATDVGVIEYESHYDGFLIEQGVCYVWHADHDFGYDIDESPYIDFFDIVAKLGPGFWDDEDGDD